MSHDEALLAAMKAYDAASAIEGNWPGLEAAINAYLAATKPTGEVGEVITALRSPYPNKWARESAADLLEKQERRA